jgi:hypothetical protein
MSSKLILTTFAAMVLAATAFADERPFQSTVARGKVERVVIAIRAGDVKVRNGAADRISIHGTVRRDNNDSGSLDRLVPEIMVRGTTATVQPMSSPARWRHRWNTNYEVVLEVPEGTSLQFETAAGEIALDGSFGDVGVDLWAGEITMKSPRNAVKELRASVRVGEVHTSFPDRRVDREGVFPGTTWWANAAGRGKVYLHTMAGDVNVDLR